MSIYLFIWPDISFFNYTKYLLQMSTTVDWSDLPPELLQTITLNLDSLSDYIHFRTVCKTWHTATPIPPLEFPWLMLPLNQSSNQRKFFNPLTNILHRLTLTEAPRTSRCAGSSHGWLVFIEESPSIFIINPLTRVRITLPPLSSFPNVVNFDFYSIGREYTLRTSYNDLYYYNLKEMRETFIKKVILSRHPKDDENFIAFAILNRCEDLAYCRNGDDSWEILHEARTYSEDVIYFDGAFYAVDKFGSIAICDVNSTMVKFINVEQQMGGDMQYLVDGMGELLLVSRYLDFDIDIEHYVEVCKTVRFMVCKLDFAEQKWVEVMNLDEKVLFIGENSSFALLASDYPGCEGNMIYFTDDYSGATYDGIVGDHDVGVFKLADGTCEAIPCYPSSCHRPIWITPTLC